MNNKLLEMVTPANVPFELNTKLGDHMAILADADVGIEI